MYKIGGTDKTAGAPYTPAENKNPRFEIFIAGISLSKLNPIFCLSATLVSQGIIFLFRIYNSFNYSLFRYKQIAVISARVVIVSEMFTVHSRYADTGNKECVLIGKVI
jgi:hypothetical protein